jgi:hypothetical protein
LAAAQGYERIIWRWIISLWWIFCNLIWEHAVKLPDFGRKSESWVGVLEVLKSLLFIERVMRLHMFVHA